MMGPGVKEMIQCHPSGRGNFWIQSKIGAFGAQEDERTHGNGRQHRGAGYYIIKGTRQLGSLEMGPDFLVSLPDGRDEKIGVFRLLSATRQRHVAAPGISGALGPADQEDAVGIGCENECDGGPDQ
jgi:hypothetical protein